MQIIFANGNSTKEMKQDQQSQDAGAQIQIDDQNEQIQNTNENEMSCYFSVNHEQKPLTAFDGKKRDKNLKRVCGKYFYRRIGLVTVANCQF